MKKILSTIAISGMVVSLYAGQAFALSTADVSLNGNDADAAYGVYGGNESLADLNGLDTSAFGTGTFQLLDKTDSVSTPIGTTTFTITASLAKSGTFILSWVDANIPPTKWFDLVFALKAANSYSYYLFDDVEFSYAPGSYNGIYEISWMNNGGQIPDLSHMSVYGRPGDPGNEVPEPATMLLFGTGLVGLAGLARRKN